MGPMRLRHTRNRRGFWRRGIRRGLRSSLLCAYFRFLDFFNLYLDGSWSSLSNSCRQDELQLLHDTIERITAERRELESLAAEQAQTCQQLTEANNTLSGRALALAEEAAQAPEMMRKQYETQLQEVKKALELAQDEVDAMRTSEQSQRIALLDELNSMQTENGNLRAQLRVAKK
jgi:hypothetical protein